MGKLLYSTSGLEVEFEDRVLAHLQVIIGGKLRRRESFFLSWRDDPAMGDGRSSIWLSNSIPLRFVYSSHSHHELNREWLDELARSAASSQGMYVLPEPGASEPAAPPRVHV